MPALVQQLEIQADILRNCAGDETGPDRIRYNRHFELLLELLQPRIRHLIYIYGLGDLAEDAQQACAIGVFRALESYDSVQAGFSTHVTWQLRGELQGLRHRMRLDQRRSARAAGIRTVSLEGLVSSGGEGGMVQFEDEDALPAVESCASDLLTRRLINGLMERLGSPQGERAIIHDTLFGEAGQDRLTTRQREQRRQIVRRTWRNCTKALAAGPVVA